MSAQAVKSAGYVLVGGRSSRMGRDKALLPLRGGVLAEWVARCVRQSAGTATLVGDPARYSSLGMRVIPDLFPEQGPLGGILTALRDSAAPWNLIVACDMPGIDVNLLATLIQTAQRSQADVLLPLDPEGRPQPLCAVYNRGSLASLERAFAQGVRKVTLALAGIQTLRLPMQEVTPFQNINTPEDWSAYAG
jgi:molybdopterin-guanine dinucleotide biosynthesis protein A